MYLVVLRNEDYTRIIFATSSKKRALIQRQKASLSIRKGKAYPELDMSRTMYDKLVMLGVIKKPTELVVIRIKDDDTRIAETASSNLTDVVIRETSRNTVFRDRINEELRNLPRSDVRNDEVLESV